MGTLKVALEFDDFSPRNSHFDILEDLKEHYPNFKVTMFTVPWQVQFGGQTPITQPDALPWVEAVKRYEDWIEICLHGMTHAPAEFAEISYDEAKKRVIISEKMFENRGIKLQKIFKAPFWQLSDEGRKAVTDLGYRVVDDHYYDWNLAEERDFTPFDNKDLIIGHGHVQDTMGNGMSESLERIMKLPPKTEFLTLSEVLK